ncbi:MAG: MTH1187 family thiamine-binding protein [Deferrisomatales bacterium]|nr:MTH1187 family thiamine-binding protein [Deferrisomatales bacterium]
MAILQISVIPIGTRAPGLSRQLAPLPELLDRSGLRYQIHPMGTVVEGDPEDLLRLAAQLHEAPFGSDCQRVLTQLTLDDRRDVARPMEKKVESLLRAAAAAGASGDEGSS